MQISIEYDYVFLCQPKCASTAIEKALTPYSDLGSLSGRASIKHTNTRQYNEYIRPYITQIGGKDCETICLMREPISRLVSFYKYRSREALSNPDHPNHHRSTANISFTEFIEGYLADETAPYSATKSQLSFIIDNTGAIGVDKIFAYENIQYFLDYMSQKIGSELKLPLLNQSPSRPIETLEPTLQIALEKALEKDIAFYNTVLNRDWS